MSIEKQYLPFNNDPKGWGIGELMLAVAVLAFVGLMLRCAGLY